MERDSRSQEMRVVMEVCPRGEMSRCLCQDKSVAKFPFDMTTFFQTCKPDKVSINKMQCKLAKWFLLFCWDQI